ncbi:MAG: SPOR domain-containing protein [Treponema sp.]|jgi:hypothetical protein|nr:SPOR domain-containing protein [Treponema sp.]
MGLTRPFAPFLLLLGGILCAPLFGQNPIPLGTEMQNLERLLGNPGTGAAEKREALRRLARLQELAGNMEGAAESWVRAAGGAGEARDDKALLRGAYAFSAMGDWEKAGEAVKTLLLSAGDREILREARLLGAQIEGFRAGDAAALVSLLDDREYEPFKPAIYYTLWKIQGDGAWKNRLLAECSRSPEGRIAAGDSLPVSAVPRAMWLLLPGRAGFSTETPGPAAQPAPAAAQPTPTAAQPTPAASQPAAAAPAGPATSPPAAQPTSAASRPTAAAAAPAGPAASPPASAPEAGKPAVLLQTGLFGREANAGAMAERLRNAGFAPSVGRRAVNGTDYWAVTVEPGQDMQGTVLRLKDAGFESFPVY